MADGKKTQKIYLYTRFERFWHWIQGLMIACLLITGFEIHGTYALIGFENAVKIHNYVGLAWLIMFAFFVFWLFTTGEWKQYIPTTKKLFTVIRYYLWGIFKGMPHPVKKTPGAKHNALQRLAYLGISAVLLPLQMGTGLLFYLYNDIPQGYSLSALAIAHTFISLLLLNFLIIHIYMTTTGHTVFSHITGMITGWEEIDKDAQLEEWETPIKKS